jgi:Peptidase A4 family
VRAIRSLLTVVPTLAVLTAGMTVGVAATAQASTLAVAAHRAAPAVPAAHAATGRSIREIPGAGLTVPPEIRPAGTKADLGGSATAGEVSANWAGYSASGGSYTSVTSSWEQPAVTCTTDGIAVFWVGLDGGVSSDQAVEQIGTAADCTTGTPVYYDWYELYPTNAVTPYADVVKPGDDMVGTVIYTGSGNYELELADQSRGWTENHTYYDPGRADATAEIVAEAPTSGGGIVPLPDFGSVGFSNSRINNGLLSAANAQQITMQNGGTTLAVTSATTPNGNFMVTCGNGQNIGSLPILAFEANTTGLWGSSNGFGGYLGQNMDAGTSPSVTALSGGGFEGAFQNSAGQLVVFGTALTTNTQAGMMAGTSPSIAPGPSGTFEVAFQANTGALWTYTTNSYVDQSYGMMAGTNPSIAAVSGGYEIAFQANTGALWVVGTAGNIDTAAGMMAGTSPSIATNSANAFEVAFQANTGALWTYNTTSYGVDQSYGMMAGTNPAIAALPDNSFEIAFQANSGQLWNVGRYYTRDTDLSMAAGTSPGITADPNVGFEVAFEASTSALWIQNPSAGGVDWGSGMHAGSSPSISY